MHTTRRRSARIEATLGLDAPRPSSFGLDAVLVLTVAGLLALAAAQPVVSATASTKGRSGAEVYVVVDITRSMLARRAPREPTRLERAKRIAALLRAGVPDVRMGVASLTDRVLPHLFPTLSTNAFTATVDRAIDIERPPPDRRSRRATALGALEDLGQASFYEPDTRHRLAVVLTDGESLPIEFDRLGTNLRVGRIRTLFVHLWRDDEAIFKANGQRNPDYRPDPRAPRDLRRIAGAVDGVVFAEPEVQELVAAVAGQIGTGDMVVQSRQLVSGELAPLLVALSAFPLFLLLWRRNA